MGWQGDRGIVDDAHLVAEPRKLGDVRPRHNDDAIGGPEQDVVEGSVNPDGGVLRCGAVKEGHPTPSRAEATKQISEHGRLVAVSLNDIWCPLVKDPAEQPDQPKVEATTLFEDRAAYSGTLEVIL